MASSGLIGTIPAMRNMIRIAVSLVVVGLVGCGRAGELGQEDAGNNGKPAGNSNLVVETGGWKDGDKIPSGKSGVPDIEILEVHKNGSGDVCGSGKTATLAYKAMLSNGKVIDPGTQPFTFRVGARGAIEGWDIVVAKMKVGDSFTIALPQALAYGPSKGDLKFDMELLSFK